MCGVTTPFIENQNAQYNLLACQTWKLREVGKLLVCEILMGLIKM